MVNSSSSDYVIIAVGLVCTNKFYSNVIIGDVPVIIVKY